MAEDWSIDVLKYAPDANPAVIAGIVRYCGIALRSRDASLVSFSDPTETARVRENFLKKKLALTDADDVLDAAIAGVGERMQGDTTKNRVTVYYLLAEAYDRLSDFISAKDAAAAAATAAPLPLMAEPPVAPPPPAPVAVAAPPAPVVAAPPVAPVAPPPPPVAAAPLAAMATAPVQRKPTGFGLWQYAPLGLMALGGAALIAFLLQNKAPSSVPVAATPVAAVAAPVAAAAIPDGAGVTTETLAGKPKVSVYFDTAKADLHPDIVPAVATMMAYLDANPDSRLVVSGFSDPRGNAAFNAELSKNRAIAVGDALVNAGIPKEKIELRKPSDVTDETADLSGARRVEIAAE